MTEAVLAGVEAIVEEFKLDKEVALEVYSKAFSNKLLEISPRKKD